MTSNDRIRTCGPRSLSIDQGLPCSAINSRGRLQPAHVNARTLGHVARASIVFLSATARAAESLPSVSPPTDWTGVAVVIGLGLAIFLPIIYAVYVKLKSGMQPGEETIERIANALHAKMNPTPAVSENPLVYDGHTFVNAEELAKYKAAKAVVDSYGATP